jgi:phosphopantetheinyl transferase (holo-ACP synthase)
MSAEQKLAAHLPSSDWLLDHRFEGHTVLPAVVAVRLLKEALLTVAKGSFQIRKAEFPRFLQISSQTAENPLTVSIANGDRGTFQGHLQSTIRSRASGFSRTLDHAIVSFEPALEVTPLPWDIAVMPEGLGFTVPAAALYAELVPFGPAFHNVKDPIYISPDGVLATVDCPSPQPELWPPGVLFPLDAAFHLCCLWCQRYHGVTAFPVGFGHHKLVREIKPGAKIKARIVPCPTKWLFDIWLYDDQGEILETCLGVRMADISRGRLNAPEWLLEVGPANESFLAALGVPATVIALASLPLNSMTGLTPRELERFNTLGERRQRSYLAARIAMKRLARRLSPTESDYPAESIETLADDDIRPRCGATLLHSAAAHDPDFAIAVASRHPVGVDVELISEKAVRGARLFLDDNEQKLIADNDRAETATRMWTVKESVAKMLSLPLAKAWQRARIVSTRPDESRVSLDGRVFQARHVRYGEHIFTVISDEEESSC